MKLFVALLMALFGTIHSAQLNNNYLPPVGASQAGGGVGLIPPNAGNSGNAGLGGFLGANVPIAPGRPQAVAPGRPQPAPGRPQAVAPGRPPIAAQPSAPAGPTIEIVSYENVNNGDGSYKWSYEGANGIKAQETGDVKNKGSDNQIQVAIGSYSFTSPEGEVIQISYTADENGFIAEGNAIPTPVPLPEENLKAIAEFEAAFATAVPESAANSGSSQSAGGSFGSASGSSSFGSSSGSASFGSSSGSASFGGSSGSASFGGSSAKAGPRPSGGTSNPSAFGGSKPAAGSPSFGAQPRPGGGSGNYNPQSGYSY